MKRSARERLAALVDPAIDGLRKALEDDDVGAIIRAARIVLDRTGHGPRQTVELEDAAALRERLIRACEAINLHPQQALVLAAALEAEGEEDAVH